MLRKRQPTASIRAAVHKEEMHTLCCRFANLTFPMKFLLANGQPCEILEDLRVTDAGVF